MSEKVTFRELIESIAEETENSKQFTHDFLKDFVDVINDGLEKDRKVNIAGFGKFKLRRMDEREGYNPSTGEKINIPEHNKIVFKPYKDLRELVNAPYSHLEPELIEEETTENEEDEKEIVDSAEAVDETPEDQKQQDDFIPTAPPTSHQDTGKDSATANEATEDQEEEFSFDFDDQSEDGKAGFQLDQTEDVESTEFESEEAPFALDDQTEDAATDKEEDITEETSDLDADIVEFSASTEQTPSGGEEPDNDLNEFMGTSEESSQDDIEKSPEEDENTDPFAPGFEEPAEQEPETGKREENPLPAATVNQKKSRSNSISTMPIIAAATVLLLLAAGAWYFYGGSSPGNSPEMVIDEPTTTVADDQNNSDQDQDENQVPAADQNQNQSQATTSTNNTPEQKASNDTVLDIEEGQTLWSIAEEKYGNPRLWPWIYGTNESLENPNLILAGKSLSVPLPSGPQNTLNSSDSVGVAQGFVATYSWYKNRNETRARNHLWAAKSYHNNIREITDLQIDKADLTYADQDR